MIMIRQLLPGRLVSPGVSWSRVLSSEHITGCFISFSVLDFRVDGK